MKTKHWFVSALLLFCPLAEADQPEVCLYRTESGRTVQVSSLKKIPERYRKSATCLSQDGDPYLAKPQDIVLEGTARREEVLSPVGKIELRWPRKIESLFGRTPERALADAAQTVSRVLKRGAFPTPIQNLKLNWQVIYLDENLPETQIPHHLVSNCHPGWMTPPANIYIVAQRAAAGCGNSARSITSVADSQLAQVLIHEMGHAVEFALLQNHFANNRMRAEGFATWFEHFASDYSSIIRKGSAQQSAFELAKKALEVSPNSFEFTGSAADYARASLFFHAIVERRNLQSLIKVYDTIISDGLDFYPAVEKSLNWNKSQLFTEAARIVTTK